VNETMVGAAIEDIGTMVGISAVANIDAMA
jgi:hypothetical protein